MNLRTSLSKSRLSSLESSFKPIYKNNKTAIYDNGIMVDIFTTEFQKYQFYYYAVKNKLSCIPKINQLIADDKHGVYYIEREYLSPVTDMEKLTRIDSIKYWIENRISNEDKIVNDLLKFYNLHNDIDFDFSPHWIMQTSKGKLVIADAFRERNERFSSDYQF